MNLLERAVHAPPTEVNGELSCLSSGNPSPKAPKKQNCKLSSTSEATWRSRPELYGVIVALSAFMNKYKWFAASCVCHFLKLRAVQQSIKITIFMPLSHSLKLWLGMPMSTLCPTDELDTGSTLGMAMRQFLAMRYHGDMKRLTSLWAASNSKKSPFTTHSELSWLLFFNSRRP